MDLASASAADLARALRARDVSSRELLDHYLARIEAVNPALNVVVALDVERAQAAAQRADDEAAKGGELGPLHGLPMTVKDVWETEGFVTTSGVPELRDYVPDHDAVAIARLKQAGAIVFGKTNTPMWAGDFQTYNDVYGRSNNPWDLTRGTGGSSGGAAAAVAAGLTSFELGSDIGGSIRNPAHYNGVYGLKPSWGVVPSRGHLPGPPGSLLEPDVNCNGPLARTLEDLALSLDVIAGPLPEDAPGWRLELDAGAPIDGVSSLRVGTVFHEGSDFVPLAADVRASLEAFAGRLADAGAKVEAITMPVPLHEGVESWRDMVLPIIGLGLSDEEYAFFTAMDDVESDDDMVHHAHALGSRYKRWAIANQVRQQRRRLWARAFEDYDVVLAPVMPTAAFPHDTDRTLVERVIDIDGTPVPHLRMIAWCGAIGAMLVPVVALPVDRTPSGLPVGVQVIGPYLSDRRLLNIAAVLDEAAGPGFTPPPV